MRWALALAGVALVAVSASRAAAARPAFSGRCQFSGSFAYSRPVGFAPTAVRWSDQGTGTCTGSLGGSPVTLPAAVSERLQDDIGGCGPTSDAHGTGTITIGSLASIDYRTTHPLIVGAPFVARGKHTGGAVGVLTAYLHGSLPIVEQCLASEFRAGQYDMVWQTTSPIS